MNALKVFVAAALLGVSNALFLDPVGGIGLAGITGLGAAGTGTTLAISAGGAAALGVAGLAVLKVAALAKSQARRGGRLGKRSADNESQTFALISAVEPENCYKRIICDLATGQMAKSENDVILSLFDESTPVQDPKFEYTMAAKLGKELRNIRDCEIRYSCSLSGKDIQALF